MRDRREAVESLITSTEAEIARFEQLRDSAQAEADHYQVVIENDERELARLKASLVAIEGGPHA